MNLSRAMFLSASAAGLAISVWGMRPKSFAGFAFAALWCSLAWLALAAFSSLSTRMLPIFCSLLLVAFTEILFFQSADPLAYAVKPLYQLIAFVAGATVGWVISKALRAWA